MLPFTLMQFCVIAVRRENDTGRQEGSMADTLINKRRILSYLWQKGKSKNGYRVKSVKIFTIKCAKMISLTFGVGIKRRKIDEYRT